MPKPAEVAEKNGCHTTSVSDYLQGSASSGQVSDGRKEEAENVVETTGPGVFAVDAARDALVGEVDVFAPASALEQTEKMVGVAKVLCSLAHAHVEPDAEVRASKGCLDKAENAAVVPPDGWGEHGDLAEDVGILEAEEERNESAEGGASDGSAGGAGLGAIGPVDLWLEFLDEETGVAAGFAPAEFEVAGGGVLGHAAEAGVGDADEDDGLDLAGLGEAVGSEVGLPGVAGDVGGEVVEEVLAVVEVEDGEAAVWIREVGLG